MALTHDPVRIFLCGDVMTGRGIDQVLPHPCGDELREDHVRSATEYVRLAEDANGPIPRPVAFPYVWGVALDELDRARPDVRMVNLETSITRSSEFEAKGINYRMSPENAGCLAAAKIDCCVLANNHVLDFGQRGLLDTVSTLEHHHIETSGAGRNAAEATAPAIVDLADGTRVLVWSFADASSGVPASWAATDTHAGVNRLPDTSEETATRIARQIALFKEPRDIAVVSLHWGPNWGYDVPAAHRQFAHALIERADVSMIHGHSSHHPKTIEFHRSRAILYGCGDFLNDYEGIAGYERYRDDLALMYFADVDTVTKDVARLELGPLQIRRFQLVHCSEGDARWLQTVLDRESSKYFTRVIQTSERRLCASPG
jgi:poly-gamma-glutamate capsule biosynthesis protein CapA/YwtB (metallophosphatase superfamily)